MCVFHCLTTAHTTNNVPREAHALLTTSQVNNKVMSQILT
jgi:hypothetical protein